MARITGLQVSSRDVAGHPGAALIELKGDLDTPGGQKLAQEVFPIIEKGSISLIFNFCDLEYINSIGIYNLMRCFKKASNKGGFLKLVAVKDQVREVLEVVGLTAVIRLYNTLDEALADI